jgi:hypothetical protein
MSPFSLPATPLKGAEVFASAIGVKALNMMGQMMTYSFLESLSKGKRCGEMKAKDSGNITTSTKGSFIELLSKGNLGAPMKAKSNDVSSTPTNKSFLGSFSKGTLVKMKAKGGPLPLPQLLKAKQVLFGANVGTGFPFVKKTIAQTRTGPAHQHQEHQQRGQLGLCVRCQTWLENWGLVLEEEDHFPFYSSLHSTHVQRRVLNHWLVLGLGRLWYFHQ